MARPRALAAKRPGAEPGSREGALLEMTMRDAAVGEGLPLGAPRAGWARGGNAVKRGQVEIMWRRLSGTSGRLGPWAGYAT